MAKHGDRSDKHGSLPNVCHTFVLEIDRQGATTERLRWRWPQSLRSMPHTSSSTGDIARELLGFLDSHLLAHDANTYSGVLADKRPRGYSVEMYDPSPGEWIPLSQSTPSGSIPKNCRVRVNIPSPPASGGNNDGVTPSRPSEKSGNGAIPAVDEVEMLALPWRRFGDDLLGIGAGGNAGLEICGRRLVIGDVSNSSEGTGLFTWDGSVLLAKYLEHQAVGIRRDLGGQLPSGETHPLPIAPETAKSMNGSVNDTTDKNRANNEPPVVRVLELGCGTGLAGLAAAFSFGRRENLDAHGESRASLRPFAHQAQPCESEDDGVRAYSLSPTLVDGSADVVLTDLEYALANARENINRNALSLKAVGGAVKTMELDWCRPLPEEFIDGNHFDLILAADCVWLDELVEPLVRTLELLTAGWHPCSDDRRITTQPPADQSPPKAAPQERGLPLENPPTVLANSTAQERQGAAETSPRALSRGTRPRPGRRVLLAYQWRSQRTGKALLEELEKGFHVREIPPEECHPEYLPSSNLCLFEAVRRLDGVFIGGGGA